jgi:shikimate dehydrogenase
VAQLLGLIGDPVGHSISPVFQQAALDALHIEARYEAWQTPLAELPARVAWLRETNALGANVTVPHKRAVMPLLDEVGDAARRTGAVNTIVARGGRLSGHNTDITGFISALREDGGLEPNGLRVAVVGAGGAARAVVWGLLGEGASEVLVLNRTVERARELAADLGEGRDRVRAAALPPDAGACAALLTGHDLLVNCTSIGMRHSATEGQSPIPAASIPAGCFVADIVANPLETPLLKDAATRGCRTLGGLAMLVRQGAASFELWTGRNAPLDVMFAAAREAMEESQKSEVRSQRTD